MTYWHLLILTFWARVYFVREYILEYIDTYGYLLYTKHNNILKPVNYILLREYTYLAPNTDQPWHLHHTAFFKTQKYRVILLTAQKIIKREFFWTLGEIQKFGRKFTKSDILIFCPKVVYGGLINVVGCNGPSYFLISWKFGKPKNVSQNIYQYMQFRLPGETAKIGHISIFTQKNPYLEQFFKI